MELKITETALRDANQSLIATRMTRDQFEAILPDMNKAGYYSIECWGGAVFDSCIRYLDEDPWDRLKFLRKNLPDTKLQMLLRGQSLLGYKHYSDEVVRKFVFNAVEKGIDIIRIFDAMNDIRNIAVAVNETIKCEAHPSCAISYTVSPVHNIDNYVHLAKQMEAIGAQSICIKDMAGILSPSAAYELISRLKRNTTLPIILHSHCSTGYAYMTYLKAIEAGVDVVDTAISSFSGGTSQPATEVIAKAAVDSGRQVSLNMENIKRINSHFEKVMDTEIANENLDIKTMLTRPSTLENQIPGGMFSNLLAQLKQYNAEDKIDEVAEEVIRVREDLGYPPLVTPISQMVGTQATLNVLLEERYKQVIDEIKAYFRGEYGMPPGAVNEELMLKLVGTTVFPDRRLSEVLPSVYEKTKVKLNRTGRSDVLTSVLFPSLSDNFFKMKTLENFYSYCFSEYKDNEPMTNRKDVSNEISSEKKAMIMSIIAYKTGVPINELELTSIYEINEPSSSIVCAAKDGRGEQE